MMLSRAHPPPNLLLLRPHASLPVPARLPIHTSIVRPRRPFTSSTTRYQQQQHRKESFSSRLREALARTRIQWYSIPAVAGIGFLGLLQFTKVQRRERARLEEEGLYGGDGSGGEPPKKRKRTTPEGPWQVRVMSTLPLKAISRVWGWFNSLEIPYYLRVPGFRLYSFVFGVNLSEVAEPDLHAYPNLAAFFYRTLKPGSRPIDPNPNALVSPADGKVIQFGQIEGGQVEQVKGVTYSLDALLGSKEPIHHSSNISTSSSSPQPSGHRTRHGDAEGHLDPDEEFARVNGISYTLPHLFSGDANHPSHSAASDQSTQPRSDSEDAVREDFAGAPSNTPWWSPISAPSKPPTTLYYMVVYLAPGDYHRFHSPVSWVVNTRRHFAGELYSVSPYLQRTLPGLFTLNERVVLLGRWRWGFFSYTPVGATNVGSIVVNFDRELRTNSLITDTAADRAAEEAAKKGEVYSGFAEATYKGASRVLGGHALRRGEEMGGFMLGSTIVLVFEGPEEDVDEDGKKVEGSMGWKWLVEKGMHVKMGQALGEVVEEGRREVD